VYYKYFWFWHDKCLVITARRQRAHAAVVEPESFGNADFFRPIKRPEHNPIIGRAPRPWTKEELLCQIETEPAQRTRGPNQVGDQDRAAEKGRNKTDPVVEKGQKAEAVPDPAAAEVAAREQVIKIARMVN
jgi:hypothetical protein